MNRLRELLSIEKKKRCVHEQRHFKTHHIGYWSLTLEDGTVEFWARPVPKLIGVDEKGEEMWSSAGQHVCLAKIENGELVTPKYFHEMDMNLQRGATRLFEGFGIWFKPKHRSYEWSE